jgi:uncharacterized protein YjiS (DUF1127 family)
MALVLSGERPAAAAASNPLGLIVVWFAKARAGYAQRQALQDLLDLDAHRLNDLGISRNDLFDAMGAGVRSTHVLAERRRRHAVNYLNR